MEAFGTATLLTQTLYDSQKHIFNNVIFCFPAMVCRHSFRKNYNSTPIWRIHRQMTWRKHGQTRASPCTCDKDKVSLSIYIQIQSVRHTARGTDLRVFTSPKIMRSWPKITNRLTGQLRKGVWVHELSHKIHISITILPSFSLRRYHENSMKWQMHHHNHHCVDYHHCVIYYDDDSSTVSYCCWRSTS